MTDDELAAEAKAKAEAEAKAKTDAEAAEAGKKKSEAEKTAAAQAAATKSGAGGLESKILEELDGIKERVSRIDGGAGAKRKRSGTGMGPVFDLFGVDGKD